MTGKRGRTVRDIGHARRLALLTLLTLLGALGAAPAAWASTIAVSTTEDKVAADGHCSLREAIDATNTDTATPGAGECPAGSGIDTIVVPAGRYVLTRIGTRDNANQRGDLDVTHAVTIVGAGAATTIIDGGKSDRVLQVFTGRTVTIEGATITGGRTEGGREGSPHEKVGKEGTGTGKGEDAVGATGENAEPGGGIYNEGGALTLVDCVVAGNATGNGGNAGNGYGGFGGPGGGAGGLGIGGSGGSGGSGGGIDDTGVLTLRETVVTENVAGHGGNGGLGAGGSAVNDGAGSLGVGGSGGHGGDGGGVSEGEGGQLIVERSAITDNRTGAGGPGGEGIGGSGGGGGATASAGALGGNAGGGSAGLGGWGGGIAAGDPAILSADLIANNTTGAGGAVGIGIGGNGGPGGTAGGAGGQGGYGNGGSGNDGGWGAGIYAAAPVLGTSLTNVTITANTVGPASNGGEGLGGEGGPGNGGGKGGNGGKAFGGNGGEGGEGGAIANGGLMRILSSTITVNTAGAAGTGGSGVGGPGGKGTPAGSAGAVEPGISLPAGRGGIITRFESPEKISLQDTIVAGNGPANCFPAMTDAGHNISFPDATCPGANVDPKLGPLTDNGGPTQTQALLPGSPALDAVPAAGASCPATDQRGVSRPQGPACDIGAFELFVAIPAGGGAGGGGGGTPQLGGTPGPTARIASLSGLGESFSIFALASGHTPLTGTAAAHRHHRGTVFSFALDRPATVVIAIASQRTGRRVGSRCLAAKHTLRHRPRCTRSVRTGTLTRAGHAGRNSVPFTGRIGAKALKPGRYRATFTATDTAGTSLAHSLSFVVVAR